MVREWGGRKLEGNQDGRANQNVSKWVEKNKEYVTETDRKVNAEGGKDNIRGCMQFERKMVPVINYRLPNMELRENEPHTMKN